MTAADPLHQARRALTAARRVTVLTGAGISAESGIPTFREAQIGLWATFDPRQLASPEGFAENPGRVWDWYQWRRTLIGNSAPNPGHRALAELQRRRPDLVLITQNVDGLHQRAGSRGVLELHGSVQRTVCSVTRRAIDADWLARHADDHPPPSPHHPDGLARPDVVWFGEALPADVLEAAFEAAANCDLMLVVGTSGEVHPAAGLPRIAREQGATIIDVNPQADAIREFADLVLARPGGEVLPKLIGPD
ncbi:NAD-dependent deacylase [Wenzhouxiangella sp. XN79A]|uniref:SIR2 family NAD-dependent protein deacylase n=1 Tax=Wenzhouxiangella sp. XN79A TaxID=2724193 RepID=UPI00144AD357|nr:NAD-dependent deacylase [Wenzhouxiangella sp. XN79A]NKI34268.1 NAD-dependent deacylase [Wenzhouxiangella sp. XN79A]